MLPVYLVNISLDAIKKISEKDILEAQNVMRHHIRNQEKGITRLLKN